MMFNQFNMDAETAPAKEGVPGQTMTEYALILAAIAIVAIVAYTTLGTTIVALVNKVIACL
jgi:Flp pilus assembly pilin Flp